MIGDTSKVLLIFFNEKTRFRIMSRSNKEWTVTIKLPNEEQEEFTLYDAYSVFEEYIGVTREYFDELISSFKVFKSKFRITKGIQKVVDKDDKDLTMNAWILIISKSEDTKIPFWLLLERNTDLNGILVAVGPDSFFQYLKEEKDNIESIKKLLDFIPNYKQKFDTTIVIPNVFE